MKLKKIASLALAGVMAVSMLAGCKTDGNTSNGNDDNTVVTPSTTAIVKAVNDGQTPGNDVKIDFTVNADLDEALQKAVSVYGNDATEAEVKAAITRMTGLKNNEATTSDYKYSDGIKDGFLTGDVRYTLKSDLDGKKYSVVAVKIYDNVLTEEAALNKVAADADDQIGALAKTSKLVKKDGSTPITDGDKYYSYEYTGSISMVSVQNLDGTTSYYVAYVINQTVTEKEL